MACDYKTDGAPNPLNTKVLQYIEDTSPADRLPKILNEFLVEEGVATLVKNPQVYALIDIKENREAIASLNAAAKKFFGAKSDLVYTRKEGDIVIVGTVVPIMDSLELQSTEDAPHTYIPNSADLDEKSEETFIAKTIDLLVNTSTRFKLTADKSKYKDVHTGKLYSRVTTFINKGASNFVFETLAKADTEGGFTVTKNDNGQWRVSLTPEFIGNESLKANDIISILRVKTATIVGSNVDMVIRDHFNGTIKTYQEYVRDAESELPFIMGNDKVSPEDAFTTFIKEVEVLSKKFKARGETVLTNAAIENFEIVLHDDTLNVAGTVDLMTVDSSGVFRIYDVKTMRQLKDINTRYGNKPSKLEKWSEQVSTYRILATNSYDINVSDESAVIAVVVDYKSPNPDFTGEISEEFIPLNIVDSMHEAVLVPVEPAPEDRSIKKPVLPNEEGSVSFEIGEEQTDSNFTEASKKVFVVKANKETITETLVSRLEEQIERLERLEDSPLTERRINEIQVLRQKLRKVKVDSATLDDYYDYVQYVLEVADRGEKLIKSIEVEYTGNHKNLSTEERAEILKTISELQQTLSAFYTTNSKTSAATMLLKELKTIEIRDGGQEGLVVPLGKALQRLSELEEEYLRIGIPIHADYIFSFAPLDINTQLQEQIDFITQNRRISGLNRRTPEYKKIITTKIFSVKERREAILDLNIQQLQDKKIGRDMIIKELREVHNDPSFLSAFADPLVYSSQPTLQLFAKALKVSMLKSTDATIEMRTNLEMHYKKFRNWKSGDKEIAPHTMYEDMLEEVQEYSRNPETKEYELRTRLSFVQEYDVSEFNIKQHKAFELLREEHSFPTEPSEYEDYFKSGLGKEYLRESSNWYSKHTEPVKGADSYILNVQKQQNRAEEEMRDAFRRGDVNEGISARIRFNSYAYELKRIVRNGIPIGKLSQPKLDMYENEKFINMPAEAREYYDVLMEIYKKDQKKLGKRPIKQNSWDDFSYILPTVRKDAIDKYGDQKGFEKFVGKASGSRDLLKDAFLAQSTDTEFGEMLNAHGERPKVIPRYYTNFVQASDVSNNITNSIITFNDMANRYEAKGELIGVVNAMRNAVMDREVFIKGKREGKGAESNAFKQLDAFINSFYYGKKHAEEATVGTFSGSKAAGVAMTATALATLSLNGLQAANQYVIDAAGGTQEGWAAEFYSREDYLWAQKTMYVDGIAAGALAEGINPTFSKKTKLHKMAEMFDIMQKFSGNFGNEAATAAKRHANLHSLAVLQSIPEFAVNSEKMLAYSRSLKGKLKNGKGEVIKNKHGEEADLWDVLIEDSKGKLIIDPKVKNFDKYEFTMKLHGILRRTNQLKGEFDRTAGEQHVVGKLLTFFRKFMVPHLRKRVGHSGGGTHIDLELGTVGQGYYQTFVNMMMDALYEVKQGDLNAAKDALIGKENVGNMKANRRRMRFETAQIALSTALYAIAKGLKDLDDDEGFSAWALDFVMYQALRYRSEMRNFRHLGEFVRILDSPMATTSFINKTLGLFDATKDLLGYTVGLTGEEDIYYQRKSGKFQKGDLKFTKHFMSTFPALSGLHKTSDPGEALKYYEIN